MNTSQSTATGPLLLDTGITGGFAQHSALCNENDMTVRELLLELSGQSKQNIRNSLSFYISKLRTFAEPCGRLSIEEQGRRQQ